MIGTIWLDSPGFYVSAAYECWYVGQSDTVAAYGPGCPAFGTLGGGTLFGAPIYSEEPGTPGIVQLSILGRTSPGRARYSVGAWLSGRMDNPAFDALGVWVPFD